MTTETVYVRDSSSGRIHKAIRIDGGPVLLTFEADNLDDAGEQDEITEAEVADAEAGALCARCFPKPPQEET